jgi:LPS-assembly lipoprotein
VIVGQRRWPLDCFPPDLIRGSLEMTRRVGLIENRSKVLAAIAALSLAGGLAGCFQPLYSESAHPGLVEDLRAIEVAPIKDRIGHYLADDLASDLNGTGQSPPPKYRLTVTVTTGAGTPTVNSELNVATSATLTGEANYTLIKVDGGAQVVKSNATAAAAYDRTQDRYADLRAQRDAEIRIARALSQEISLRLASALAGKTS